MIVRPLRGVQVDHVDHDGLNNRRLNLRSASREQNAANSRRPASKSGYRGVHQQHNRFVAQISYHGSIVKIGRFSSAEEAARAYDTAARNYQGEFAILNFDILP
jgi:hypothetical protein